MRKLLFLFMIFNFAFTQAKALDCGINCIVQKSLENQMQDHSCCNDETEDEKESKSCMDEIGGSCWHEVAVDKVSPLKGLILFHSEPSINLVQLNQRLYRPKIPDDDQHIKYKQNLRLYILKAQFLI